MTSDEFDNIADLHTWMETDLTFGSEFKLETKTVAGTGAVDSADLTANAGNNLFANGTTTYNTTHLDTVLEHVQNLDYSLVIADQYGANAQSVDNGKILAHIADAETFGDKLMVVGGGASSAEFADGVSNSPIETAQYYNNDRVIVCHGAPLKNSKLIAEGSYTQTSLHKASSICGRIAGLEPQVPITFKTIKVDGEVHKLSNKEQKQGLDNGVLMTKIDGSSIRCIQGVNSIQDNKVTGNYESGLKLNHSHNNSFYNNLIYDNGCEGIWLFFSYYNDFYENVVSGNKRGFELGGYKNKIWNNIIENNSEFGIHFWATCANKIYKNNFINNKDDASFSHIFLIGHSKINEFFWINNNQFDLNYWGKSRLLPKLIFGYVKIFYDFENKELLRLPWLDIDWNPAKEPYDIPVPEV